MNTNAYGQPIKIAGKPYKHGVHCHAKGVVYDVRGYERFIAEVGIDDSSTSGSVYFKAMNVFPKQIIANLKERYPKQLGILSSYLGSLETWLITEDASVERNLVSSITNKLKKPFFYQKQLKQIADEQNMDVQIRQYLEIFETLQKVFKAQKELEWLNIPAVILAFDDLKKRPGYNVVKYEAYLKKLIALQRKGFDEIYQGNQQTISDVYEAVSYKRAILLGNPLLDGDRIVATRFLLGTDARKAMAPDLGTQANNWSNQESARRSGFDAEIVELSNLRGDIKKGKYLSRLTVRL